MIPSVDRGKRLRQGGYREAIGIRVLPQTQPEATHMGFKEDAAGTGGAHGRSYCGCVQGKEGQ
jgi:hypothetical protein